MEGNIEEPFDDKLTLHNYWKQFEVTAGAKNDGEKAVVEKAGALNVPEDRNRGIFTLLEHL